jgi:hypothetical protein
VQSRAVVAVALVLELQQSRLQDHHAQGEDV